MEKKRRKREKKGEKLKKRGGRARPRKGKTRGGRLQNAGGGKTKLPGETLGFEVRWALGRDWATLSQFSKHFYFAK